MKLDHSLSLHAKANSEWIKHLNIRSETIHYIEENTGTKCIGFGHREHFIDLTTKTREVKAKINEWKTISN